ncbi:MAG: anaerobic ribonucleoside-triphosphate reductase activating protein [bacterium]|nr:anaerobic ribonucleoside-triphosphate reductase activating protein [bacterium]
MLIAGFQKMTLLDYPGKLAALIFTQGCNMACGYCHNPDMIPMNRLEVIDPELDPERILDFLSRRKGMLDGVVISGGEATLQKDLRSYINKIKAMGFLVKLDTNGSNPGVLKEMFARGLLDYVAMDIKFSPSGYRKYCPLISEDHILDSINQIRRSGIEYEFRSTVLPFYHNQEEIRAMGKMIQGAQRWYLQNFRSLKTLSKRLGKERSFSSEELKKLQQIASAYAKGVEIRI